MLAMIVALFELGGAWLQQGFGPYAVRDINGTLIAVGNTVKLVGTVISVNPSDSHYMEVVFQPVHPGSIPYPPQQGNYLMPTAPLPGQPVFKVSGQQLVVGS